MHTGKDQNLGKIGSLLLIGVIVFAALAGGPAPAARAATTVKATLVRTILTSKWNPPSPDPSGLTYWPAHNSLVVSDGEVDEMPKLFTGDNIFEAKIDANIDDPHRVVNTYTTLPFSNEPAGLDIAFDTTNDRFFISDDDKDRVFEIDLGDDRKFGTSDDTLRSFSTRGYGDTDPEGLTYAQGKLFLVDGSASEVYRVDPGNNGTFDGGGDDQVSHFDTLVLPVQDPEGIEFDPSTGTLYIVGTKRQMAEVTTSGALVRIIDISPLNAKSPADVALAPSSQNSSEMHLYIADRGVDNNTDPNENDGKIYEISLTGSSPSGNLLVNPGFETVSANGLPNGWSEKSSNFTRSNGDGVVTPHGGSFVGKHFANNDAKYMISQPIGSLTAGTAYTGACWVNIPATSDTFTFKVQVSWLNGSNGTISTAVIKKYTAATNGWNQATKAIVAPAGTVSAQFQMAVSSLKATVYVDDCTFSQ